MGPSPRGGGWSGGAKVLGKLPVPGRPTDLEQPTNQPTQREGERKRNDGRELVGWLFWV